MALPASNGYRLSGVIDAGSNNRMGFLELPGGGQVLIRQGTTIAGGGRVVEFSSRSVRIAFPDGHSVAIDLQGSGLAAPAAVTQVSHPIEIDPAVTSTYDQGAGLVRHISLANFGKAVALSSASSADLTRRLQPLLKLPVDSHIVSVNDMPVGAAPAAIRKIQSLLAANSMATLNIEGPSGSQRVYLMPDALARP
jgi:hypothetical protein